MGGRALKSGRYRLLATPGAGRTVRATFRVIKQPGSQRPGSGATARSREAVQDVPAQAVVVSVRMVEVVGIVMLHPEPAHHGGERALCCTVNETISSRPSES